MSDRAVLAASWPCGWRAERRPWVIDFPKAFCFPASSAGQAVFGLSKMKTPPVGEKLELDSIA